MYFRTDAAPLLVGGGQHMNTDGFFWYSEQQKRLTELHRFERGIRRICNIRGKEYEYTEWKSGKCLRNPSNFRDATCLGYGYIVRVEIDSMVIANESFNPTEAG